MWIVIISAISMIAITLWSFISVEKFSKFAFTWIFFVVAFSAFTVSLGTYADTDTEKRTAIKCHKGNNPYEMKIRYELRDSIIYPVDTIYIKK